MWVFVSEKIEVAFLGTLWIFLRFGLIKLMVLERSMVYGIVLYCYIHTAGPVSRLCTKYEMIASSIFKSSASSLVASGFSWCVSFLCVFSSMQFYGDLSFNGLPNS